MSNANITQIVQVQSLSCLHFMLTWIYAPDVSYGNPILFSSEANSGGEQENKLFYQAVTCMLTEWLSQ